MSFIARTEPITGIVLYRCTHCGAATANRHAVRKHTWRECLTMRVERLEHLCST